MPSLFEPTSAVQIITRLEKINPAHPPQWGKMNAAQMMAHCQAPFQVFFGEMKMKRGLIGYLFGGMAKKRLLQGNKPWSKNMPTAKAFLVADQREFIKEKMKLVEWIRRFSTEGATVTSSTHPFFGQLSSQEWAVLAYRHLDHHLQQFGA